MFQQTTERDWRCLLCAYRETGRFQRKLDLIGIVGAALIVKGILTLIKGEQEDSGDDPINPLFY